MSKDISTGIDKIIKSEKRVQLDSLATGWKSIKDKLDILLLTNNVMKTNDTMIACRKIDDLTHEERVVYINDTWGPLYTEKSMPLLLQMKQIENLITKS